MSGRSSQGKISDISVVSDAVASDGERAFRRRPGTSRSTCESSSSSEGEEGYASPPPNKRRKHTKHKNSDPRIDSLINQVNYISGYLTQIPHYIKSMNQNVLQETSIPCLPISAPSQYLVNPSINGDSFTLGNLQTDYDDKKVTLPAKKERLEMVNKLQHFDTQAWKGIRYKSLLQRYAATPGFVALKVNEELCHFNKTKDYLSSAENLFAILTNAQLHHQELLRQGLQDLLNWAARDPSELNPTSLYGKVSGLLGPGTALHKCAEDIIQIICGRRSESIEIRRERILKEVNNPILKTMLRDIPPSAEYLFSRQALQPVIQSLGGTQTWLNQPEYTKTKESSRTRPSSSYRPARKLQTAFTNKNARSDQKVRTNNNQVAQKNHNFRNFPKRNNTSQKQK